MLRHNLKIALRNLQKYKLQNLISILCLAVGVVCFSITAQSMFNFARNTYFNNIDQGIAHFSVIDMPEAEAKEAQKVGKNLPDARLGGEFFDRLLEQKLPAVKELHGNFTRVGIQFSFDDGTDVPKSCTSYLHNYSPNYLHYHWFRSAITGKRIPELQEGDLLITNTLSGQLFGKGVDPRGFTLQHEIDGSRRTIRDVVNITERTEFNDPSSIIYIKKNPYKGDYDFPILGFSIEVAEGYTHEQLHEQLKAAFPEYYILLQHRGFEWEEGMFTILLIAVVLLLGASVLIIGVMGFLKMELQLFSLRGREIALRRTMGAKPRHLFMLLAVEVLIVFALAAVGALALTSFLADYAIPIIQRLNKGIHFDVDLIMRIELWVALFTLGIALLAAFAGVYRQLHAPVGLRVGRSLRFNTRGQGLMLGSQFTVSMFLIFAMLGAFVMFNILEKQELGDIEEDHTLYRGVLTASQTTFDRLVPDFAQRLALNPDVEDVTYCIYSPCTTEGDQRDQSLVRNYYTWGNDDYSVKSYAYSFLSTNEHLIDRFEVKIRPNLPGDSAIHKFYSAVYVRTEQVDRLRKKWNLEAVHDALTRPLYEERSYTLIGYAPSLIGYRPGTHNYPSFWMVDEDIEWRKLRSFTQLRAFDPNAHYLIFPKKGKYDKVKDAITDIYREALPGNMDEPPVHDLYDEWFRSVRTFEMMRQLCFILVIVSILCIVASVYSAIVLESRSRQKEVALRKIHGAHTRDIIQLFGRYYLRMLTVSAVLVTAVSGAVLATIHSLAADTGISDGLPWLILYLILAILTVAGITLLTIGHKIWQVSRINPAEVIKKE